MEDKKEVLMSLKDGIMEFYDKEDSLLLAFNLKDALYNDLKKKEKVEPLVKEDTNLSEKTSDEFGAKLKDAEIYDTVRIALLNGEMYPTQDTISYIKEYEVKNYGKVITDLSKYEQKQKIKR